MTTGRTPEEPVAGADRTDVTVLDRVAAGYDHDVIEHVVVDAPVHDTYRAARQLDLLTVSTRLTRAAYWIRGLPERLRRRIPPRTPTRMTLDDLTTDGDWVMLGERPDREVTFGAAGRFWTPVARWHRVDPAEFAEFDQPGLGRIAAALSVRPFGADRTLLSYETRTLFTDKPTRRRFNWYWLTVSPFIRAIMRATLRTAKQEAERSRRDGRR
jgi:hypothetical protein